MTVPDLMDVFGGGGFLDQHFDGYAPRPGQIEMARAVELALSEGEHLVAEGPTGTGKSLAYLVPAALAAARSDRRVLVVTGNIALQEQLVTKDLPALAAALPFELRFALMKGRRNYLCLDRLERERRDGTLDVPGEPREEADLMKVVEWTARTGTGDVSELSFEPAWPVWRRFSVGSDDCPGAKCPQYEPCWSRLAKMKALDAHVVVTNYHMLFAHLSVLEATRQQRVLPPLDLVVLDEAHKAADVAREFFGWRISLAGLRRFRQPLLDLGYPDAERRLFRSARSFCQDLARRFRSPDYQVRLREADLPEPMILLIALCSAGALFKHEAGAASPGEALALSRLSERCREYADRISLTLSLSDPNAVSYIELDRDGLGVLCSRPVDVGGRLREQLFGLASSVIVTSATLSTSGSFALVRGELGVPKARELVVESPFDHAERSLLIVPTGLPDPTAREWPPAVARLVRQVAVAAGGRTLGLFTSYRSLSVACGGLRGSGLRVLRQGDRPRTALVDAFRSDVGSVLLGTESFWTGIDVPGESLSCVIIDRLPFPSPTDPVLDAIRAKDKRWFFRYALPRAVIAFRQGFGRLLRRADDRGVVVVLDRRLVDRPYGRLFLKSLPRVRLSRDIADVTRFLEPIDSHRPLVGHPTP